MDILVLSLIAGLVVAGGIWIATRPSRILTVAGRRLTIKVVPEDGAFVARCLDVEVTSDGPTEQEAVENLREALELYISDAIRSPLLTAEIAAMQATFAEIIERFGGQPALPREKDRD